MPRLVLTGASGVVGLALCDHFLREEWDVVACVRQPSSVMVLKERYQAYKEKLTVLALDLCRQEGITDLCQQLEGLQVQGLINNARNPDFLAQQADGISLRKNFQGELLLDVVVPYELTMALVSKGLKSVVNVSSMYGVTAANPSLYEGQHDLPVQYAVAKAGLIHLTKDLSVRLADQLIRVNAVSLGGVEGRVDKAFEERYSTLCPSGKMLKSEDVVGPIAFLLSDSAAAVTGHNLVADGGWTVW